MRHSVDTLLSTSEADSGCIYVDERLYFQLWKCFSFHVEYSITKEKQCSKYNTNWLVLKSASNNKMKRTVKSLKALLAQTLLVSISLASLPLPLCFSPFHESDQENVFMFCFSCFSWALWHLKIHYSFILLSIYQYNRCLMKMKKRPASSTRHMRLLVLGCLLGQGSCSFSSL